MFYYCLAKISQYISTFKNMESKRSKIAKFIIKNTIKRQLNTQDLNLGILRILDFHKPPFYYFFGCKIERKDIAGSIIHYIEPKEKKSDKLLLYIHGGAFIAGPTPAHWKFLSKILKQTDYNIAMVDYPKSPENDHTVIQKSVQEVYKYFIDKFDVSKMVMGGDSAGGNLTLTTALWAKDNNLPLPKSLLPLSPAVEMTMSNEDAWAVAEIDPFLAIAGIATCGKWYVNGGNPMQANFSPIYGNLEGLPPINIFCGTHDMLFPDGKKFAQKAKNAGVQVNYFEYANMMHTWMLFPIPEGKKAVKEIIALL